MSNATKYRKKPVVIEAIEFTGGNAKEVTNWIQDSGHRALGDSDGVTILTIEGNMLASPGDFIIKGVNGEFYPCKSDIFSKTYEDPQVTRKPLLHGAIEENPQGQVRVYNADGKLLIGTSCRGYLAELATE